MFKQIAVLGVGTMGQRIAQFFAHFQLTVWLYDTSIDRINIVKDEFSKTLNEKNNLFYTNDLQQAVSEADLVIESVPEILDIKRQLYKQLTPFVKPEVILCSNTSSISLSELAFEQPLETRMVITHFFNPAHLIPLVEIVHIKKTEPGIIEKITNFFRQYGKVPVVLKKDIRGFIGNRLQAAVLREACFIVENGVADARDIDTVMVEGLGIRWAFNGPFYIADLGGLDIWEKVCQRLLPDLNNNIDTPLAISEKVEKGELGFKTGKGFYNHTESSENAHTNFREQQLSGLLQLKSDMNKGIDKHG